MALIHGGQLHKISQQYAIAVENWLDLSTGISPVSYPIPSIPESVWQQLPQPCKQLNQAACNYYGCDNILATNGSQYTIAQLPELYKSKVNSTAVVWLPIVGYKEHEKAWRDQGFMIEHYHQLPTAQMLSDNSIVVVINPNNPSGVLYSKAQMMELLAHQEKTNGWLIVDEAFMDVVEPNQSIIDETDSPALFVLRSVGKFFGLAGIRLGFVSAHPKWLKVLSEDAGPWQVNGPAQFVTHQALNDTDWQMAQRAYLKTQSDALDQLLLDTFGDVVVGSSLFKTVKLDNAPAVYDQLCKHAVYVRLCDERDALRFGIPTPQQFDKLKVILARL